MNLRRKNRLWAALALLAGLMLTTALVLYALRSSIDLFYTPGEILYGSAKRSNGPSPVSVCASAGWSCPAA